MATALSNVNPWASSNLEVAYPFSAEGSGRIEPTDVRSVIADMVVRRQESPQELRLKMTYLNLSPFDIRLETTAGACVFDSRLVTVTRKTTTWGGWTVLELTSLSPVFTVIQLVLSAARAAALTWPCTQQPVLLASRVSYRTSGIRTLRFQNTSGDATVHTLNGRVTLQAGYNAALAVPAAAVGVRAPAQLSLDSQPGAGAGKYLNCGGSSDGAIHSINALGPDSKYNFQWLADNACYWMTRVTAVVDGRMTLVKSKLRLLNNCGPCCSCQDYVDVYNRIRTLSSSTGTLYDGAKRVHDKYQEFVAMFRAKTEALRAVKGVINLYPRYNWRVGVQAVLSNSTLVKVGAATYAITLQSDAQFDLAVDSASLYTVFAGREPVTLVVSKNPAMGTVTYTLTADRILGPGESALLEFEIYFAKGGIRSAATQLSAAASFWWASGSTTASASATLPGPYNL